MDSSIVFAWLRQCAPPCNTCFTGPTRVHNPNGISIGSDIFAQLTAESGMPGHVLSPKIALSHGAIWTPSNTWFIGSTRVHTLNGISIGSAIFVGLTTVTDRPTDRPTINASRSVTISRIYVRIVLRCGLII